MLSKTLHDHYLKFLYIYPTYCLTFWNLAFITLFETLWNNADNASFFFNSGHTKDNCEKVSNWNKDKFLKNKKIS